MEDSIESVFQSELLPGERIHWTGQPDPSAIFSPSDLFAIPFSLLWGGFAVNWELTVLGYPSLLAGNHSHPTHAVPIFFALWGIPFVAMGLYMVFGRFFYKAWRKGRTYYALTDKRILIITQIRGRQVQALFLNQVPVINKSIRSNGSGSLIFGNVGPGQMYGNTGLDFFGARYNQGILAFYDIPQVEGIYAMVSQLRDKAV